MKRLRLLFLLPFPPNRYAFHGGARVTAALIERLAERHEVSVLCLRGPHDPPVDDVLRTLAAKVAEVPHHERWPSHLQLLMGKPTWVTSLSVKSFAAAVEAEIRSRPPDLVQLDYPVMAQYLPSLLGSAAPRVLVEHDFAVGAATEAARSAHGLSRIRSLADARAWRRFEERVARQVDAVVVFTRRDAESVRQIAPSALVAQIALGVEVPPRPLSPLGRPPPNLLFVGSFVHPPNVEAALRLAESILPRLTEAHPDLTISLVGSRPPPVIRALERQRVRIHADVAGVTPFLDRAAVVVVPLRSGGGMRVKVMEALAAGKALVASPLALEGLDVIPGEHVLVAESDEEFAQAISSLVEDEPRRASLASRGRAWTVANLSWEKTSAAFEELYARLIQHR